MYICISMRIHRSTPPHLRQYVISPQHAQHSPLHSPPQASPPSNLPRRAGAAAVAAVAGVAGSGDAVVSPSKASITPRKCLSKLCV